MKISRETINFNKEILFGEVGAIVGTQLGGLISSNITNSSTTIAYSVVFGALVGASLFWLIMRIYDKSKKEKYSREKFIFDLKYFTPASAFFTFMCYYPTLFLITKYLLEHQIMVTFSAIFSQFVAFSFFLLGINTYRYVLIKVFNKEL
jgi:uncharacterized membrane protein YeaQ/YmgE (transglycosylase-associated protein family)